MYPHPQKGTGTVSVHWSVSGALPSSQFPGRCQVARGNTPGKHPSERVRLVRVQIRDKNNPRPQPDKLTRNTLVTVLRGGGVHCHHTSRPPPFSFAGTALAGASPAVELSLIPQGTLDYDSKRTFWSPGGQLLKFRWCCQPGSTAPPARVAGPAPPKAFLPKVTHVA